MQLEEQGTNESVEHHLREEAQHTQNYKLSIILLDWSFLELLWYTLTS